MKVPDKSDIGKIMMSWLNHKVWSDEWQVLGQILNDYSKRLAELNPEPVNDRAELIKEYPMPGTFGFPLALSQLKNGRKVRRAKWKERSYLQIEEIFDKPTILRAYASTGRMFWHPSNEDLLSEDWQVLN